MRLSSFYLFKYAIWKVHHGTPLFQTNPCRTYFGCHMLTRWSVSQSPPLFRSEGHDGGQQPGACHDVVRGTFLRCCTAKTMSRKLGVKIKGCHGPRPAAKIKRITGKNEVKKWGLPWVASKDGALIFV